MSTPIAVALYYLEQEIYSPQLQTSNNIRGYFGQALDYIRLHGHGGLGGAELRVLIAAAQRRNRLDELDEAVLQRGA